MKKSKVQASVHLQLLSKEEQKNFRGGSSVTCSCKDGNGNHTHWETCGSASSCCKQSMQYACYDDPS